MSYLVVRQKRDILSLKNIDASGVCFNWFFCFVQVCFLPEQKQYLDVFAKLFAVLH